MFNDSKEANKHVLKSIDKREITSLKVNLGLSLLQVAERVSVRHINPNVILIRTLQFWKLC
jgi:hypothetical protein